MTKTQDILITIGIIAVLVIISFFVGRCSHQPVETIKYITKIKDSVQVVAQDPIIIKSPGRIMYKDRDRLVFVPRFQDTCRPFTIVLDTILKKDTLNLRYEYPANNISLFLKQKPDSIIIRTITLQTDPVIIKRAWYLDAGLSLGSAVLGYGIGRIK